MVRRTSRLSILLVLLLLSLLVVGEVEAQSLRIYHIDVEQGDATLFVAPSGRTLLVDSGKNGHGPRIAAVMEEAGVSEIDHFVATHYHEDHYGGIDDLVNMDVRVGHAYDRGDKDFLPPSKLSQTTFTDYEAAVGGRATHLMRGETIPLDPTMLVTCIASGGVVRAEEDPQHGVNENDMSVALLIQYGAFRYFIGGDIEHETEEKIAARDLVLDADVYQANHHGSHTSSTQELLEDLRPSIIVVSNGNHGLYEHPREITLERYKALQEPPLVIQTNKYLKGGAGGNVDDEFIADVESSDQDGTIVIEVTLPDSTLKVAFPDTTITLRVAPNTTLRPDVVIERLLPNPEGSDWEGEEVTLRNEGEQSVNMTGWMLRDASGRVWTLAGLGTIAPGVSKTARRDRMPMSLNNDGDEISLLDPEGVQIDFFTYEDCEEGVWLETNH